MPGRSPPRRVWEGAFDERAFHLGELKSIRDAWPRHAPGGSPQTTPPGKPQISLKIKQSKSGNLSARIRLRSNPRARSRNLARFQNGNCLRSLHYTTRRCTSATQSQCMPVEISALLYVAGQMDSAPGKSPFRPVLDSMPGSKPRSPVCAAVPSRRSCVR